MTNDPDHWVIPPVPWWRLSALGPVSDRAFEMAWGVKYETIMRSLRSNRRESIARAALFEKLGTPVTQRDLAVVMQMDNRGGEFWDRMTIWKVSQLPWWRRWQLRFLSWRARGGKRG